MRCSWGLVGFVLSLVLLVAERPVQAQATLTSEPDRDNTIYEENQNSNGAGPTVTIGRTSGNMGTLSRRALLRFDVAGDLPIGATIDGVTLTVKVGSANADARDAGLYVVTEDWGEGAASAMGGQGAPATAGDVTWTCRFSDGAAGCMSGDEWSVAGGSFMVEASATASVGDTGTTVSWSSTQLAIDVQSWLDSPASNWGWIVIGDDEVTLSTSKQLHSREATDPADRPQLVIEYTCPDFDEDGFENVVCGGTDCDDEDAAVNPDAAEVCDGIDNDCDPATEDRPDTDMDSIADCDDNCIDDPNSEQEDVDGDGIGDACDPTDDRPNNDCDPATEDRPDTDMDSIADCEDNCVDDPNPEQEDVDGDGIGDACDPTNDGLDEGGGAGCAVAQRSPGASWPLGVSAVVLLAARRRRRAA